MLRGPSPDSVLTFDSDPAKSGTTREPTFRPVTPGTAPKNSDNPDQLDTADNSDGTVHATNISDKPDEADNSANAAHGTANSAPADNADNSPGPATSIRGAFLPSGVSGIRDLTDTELLAYDDMGTEGAYDDFDANGRALLPSDLGLLSGKESHEAAENERRETFHRLGLDPDWDGGPLRLVSYSVLVENGLLSKRGSPTYDDDFNYLLDLGILPSGRIRKPPAPSLQPTVPPVRSGKATRASSRRRKQQNRRSRQHGRPPEAAPTKDSPPTEASRPATETSGEQATSSGMERDNNDARMHHVDGRPSNLNKGQAHDIRGTMLDFAPASSCRPLDPPSAAATDREWAIWWEQAQFPDRCIATPPIRTRLPARPVTALPATGTPTQDTP